MTDIAKPPLPRPPFARLRAGLAKPVLGPGAQALGWGALALALLFALPVLSVVSSVFVASGGAWAHLASTVLPGYIVNTLILALAVGIGVPLIGTGTAWLVTMCRFPGRRLFEWALILPLAVPAYVMAYTYTDFLQVAGPLQSGLRALTGLAANQDRHLLLVTATPHSGKEEAFRSLLRPAAHLPGIKQFFNILTIQVFA